MLKTFLIAATMLLITGTTWAAGPSQIWRLEITGAEDTIVEVAEIELRTTVGGANVTDLMRVYTFEEAAAVGSAAWSIPHNLGVQHKTTTVDIIAYDVSVVAPGDWFHNSTSNILSVRSNLGYNEIEFVSDAVAPTTPELDDVWYDTVSTVFNQWDGTVWNALTVTSTTSALPQPNLLTADTIDIINGVGSTQGENNTVDITFAVPAVGAATITGFSFDTPASNRPGSAVPIITGMENRPAAAAFDDNKGSWFKSTRTPTSSTPIALQYTYWVKDPTRYPNVVEYAITAKDQDSAPKSWTLQMYKDGQWQIVDQQAAIRFDDGQTRAFQVQ